MMYHIHIIHYSIIYIIVNSCYQVFNYYFFNKLIVFFFVFEGNEEKGMKFKISSLCDDHVCVHPAPTVHPLVDSLNVSVATGIILHHLTKKNKL